MNLDPASVRRVVDLGANVGYSCLLWIARYPRTCVEAFEPHPAYAEILRDQLERNGWGCRVELHQAAAGTAAGAMFLTDAECCSRVVPRSGRDRLPAVLSNHRVAGGQVGTDGDLHERIPIRVEDLFSALHAGSIDLLKIDIEGGEHALLEDPRFAEIPAQVVVMEWHDTEQHPDGRAHATRRLAECHFRVISDPDEAAGGGRRAAGLIWAVREPATASPR